MSLQIIQDFSDDDISVEVALVIFNLMSDMGRADQYIELLSLIEKMPEIKVLISFFDSEALGEDAYAEYIASLCGENIELKDLDQNWRFKSKSSRLHQMYFQQNSINQRVNSKKIIIDCLQGEVVTPFFGETLAADFRFVTEKMQFKLSHKKYGLHPSGGLGFFLPRYIGESKSIDLLLNTDSVTAEEAKTLGLVNRVMSEENFEAECILAVKQISSINSTTLRSTKCLTYRFQSELDYYFRMEEEMMDSACFH
jgi:2-(1,2-epoxy-1,2-dihydrophenyl)acetyl-CoA isomerase